MQTDIQKIEDAFTYVDFVKIHAYMTLVDWQWGSLVPSIEELKITVRTLMDMVMASKLDNTFASTGGFTVTKFTFDYDNGSDFEIIFDIA